MLHVELHFREMELQVVVMVVFNLMNFVLCFDHFYQVCVTKQKLQKTFLVMSALPL